MSWRPHGRARVDPSRPQAWASCQRCGLNHNLVDLHYQYQWAGTDLVNLQIKVCDICMDVPAPFLKTIILPPDPPPVDQPRPEPYVFDEIDYRITEDGSVRATEGDNDRVLNSTGSEDYTQSTETDTEASRVTDDGSERVTDDELYGRVTDDLGED